MHSDLHQYVLKELDARRGSWPAISEATGVPYRTITNLAQGLTRNPTVGTLEPLAKHFDGTAGSSRWERLPGADLVSAWGCAPNTSETQR